MSADGDAPAYVPGTAGALTARLLHLLGSCLVESMLGGDRRSAGCSGVEPLRTDELQLDTEPGKATSPVSCWQLPSGKNARVQAGTYEHMSLRRLVYLSSSAAAACLAGPSGGVSKLFPHHATGAAQALIHCLLSCHTFHSALKTAQPAADLCCKPSIKYSFCSVCVDCALSWSHILAT